MIGLLMEKLLGQEEASKYSSRKKFQKGSGGAYNVAWRNKWLDEFFPKIPLAS